MKPRLPQLRFGGAFKPAQDDAIFASAHFWCASFASHSTPSPLFMVRMSGPARGNGARRALPKRAGCAAETHSTSHCCQRSPTSWAMRRCKTPAALFGLYLCKKRLCPHRHRQRHYLHQQPAQAPPCTLVHHVIQHYHNRPHCHNRPRRAQGSIPPPATRTTTSTVVRGRNCQSDWWSWNSGRVDTTSRPEWHPKEIFVGTKPCPSGLGHGLLATKGPRPKEGEGSEGKNNFVYLKSTSNVGPLW